MSQPTESPSDQVSRSGPSEPLERPGGASQDERTDDGSPGPTDGVDGASASIPAAGAPTPAGAVGANPVSAAERAEARTDDRSAAEPPVVRDRPGSGESASSEPASSAARAPAAGSEATSAAARPGGAWTTNGHPDETPPRLPPPWQRVPTSGSADRPISEANPNRSAAAARPDGPARPERSAAHQERPDGPRRPTGAAAVDGRSLTAPTGRPGGPVPTDLGNARTVNVKAPGVHAQPRLGVDTEPSTTDSEPRGGTGQVTPPGGFPMGWPRNRRPRQANLQLKRLDPWSVLKLALVLAVVLYLVWLVAVGVLYGALDGIGVWERLNGQYADLVAEQAGDQLISAGRVFGVAAVIGAINSLLFAVALSVGAFIYNVSAELVGGIEVTLSERD